MAEFTAPDDTNRVKARQQGRTAALNSQAAPVVFVHPEATRSIFLQQQRVAYAFRRSARRSIGFSVNAEGLTVSAPVRTPLAAVEAALREKAHWILGKLAQAGEQAQRRQAACVVWRDGAELLYLGEPLTLRLAPTPGTKQAPPALMQNDGGRRVLALGLPPGAAAEQIQRATQAWLLGRARRLFSARLDHFAPLLGVHWRRMSLTAARTRWGSASRSGAIRLNWRLIHFPEPIIDYVVVHELAHLIEMNHSARFWAHVARILPDCAARRQCLKDAALAPW